MDSSVPVTVEKKKTKKKKVRSSSSSNKASSVEPTQASNVDATKIRKKKQRPGEGKKKTKKKFRFQRPDVLNPLKQIGMIKECLQSGEEGVLKKPEGKRVAVSFFVFFSPPLH
jgi:hypothetical protein